MPLETEVIEIVFKGLGQKTDSKVLEAGELTAAKNVEFDKAGTLNKRRGYERYAFGNASGTIGAFGETMDAQAMRVVSFGDELLVFAAGNLWSIGSKTRDLDTRAAVLRGRVSACNTRRRRIYTAPEGTG